MCVCTEKNFLIQITYFFLLLRFSKLLQLQFQILCLTSPKCTYMYNMLLCEVVGLMAWCFCSELSAHFINTELFAVTVTSRIISHKHNMSLRVRLFWPSVDVLKVTDCQWPYVSAVRIIHFYSTSTSSTISSLRWTTNAQLFLFQLAAVTSQYNSLSSSGDVHNQTNR